MPTSPFTQDQIELLLEVEKLVPLEPEVRKVRAWDGRTSSEIDLVVENPLPIGLGLVMQYRDDAARAASMVGLLIKLTARYRPMICRYDIHDGIRRID